MKYRLSSTAVGLLLITLGCAKSEPDPIHIGYVGSQSETDKTIDKQVTQAIQLALGQVNEAKEDSERPIFVIQTDTQGKLEAYAAEAVRLTAVDKVVALMGGRTAPEVEQMDGAAVPIISACGQRTPTMDRDVLLTGLSPELRGKVAAAFVAKRFKKKRVLMLKDDGVAETSLLDAFRSRVFESVVLTESESLSKKEIEDAKSDVLLLAGSPPKESNLANVLPKVVIVAGADESWISETWTKGRDVYVVTPFVAEDRLPRAKAFAAAYKKEFHEHPTAAAALAYDAVKMVADAIKSTDDFRDSDKLANHLAELKDFEGLTGTYSVKQQRLLRPAFLVRIESTGNNKLLEAFKPDGSLLSLVDKDD